MNNERSSYIPPQVCGPLEGGTFTSIF